MYGANAINNTTNNSNPGQDRLGDENISTLLANETAEATGLGQPQNNVHESGCDGAEHNRAATEATEIDATLTVIMQDLEPSESGQGNHVSESQPLEMLGNGDELGQPSGLQGQLAMPMDDLEISSWSNPESWIDHAYTASQHGVTSTWGDSAADIELLDIPFPMASSRVDVQFPRGLTPVANNKPSQMSLSVLSMFSEHIETMEQHVRVKMEVDPNISRRV